MKNKNIQYKKECLESGICPECGDKLRLLINNSLYTEFQCDYCVEIYHPFEDPYNIDFDKVDWFNF